jgi:hypothetical protein
MSASPVISCSICGAQTSLDDPPVVTTAQVVAFAAAHNEHPEYEIALSFADS